MSRIWWIWSLLLNAFSSGAARVQVQPHSTNNSMNNVQVVNGSQRSDSKLGSFVQEHALLLPGVLPVLDGPLASFSIFDWVCLLYAALAIGCFIFDIVLRNPRLDEELANRDAEMNQMTGNYNGMVEAMGAQLQAMVDTNLNLVEQTFRDYKRDFLKFLRHVKDREDLYDGPEDGKKEVVNNFKQFVRHWLTLFRECSPDPVKQPACVFLEEEGDDDGKLPKKPSIAKLLGMNTLPEIAEITHDQLKVLRVKFLSLDSSSADNSSSWGKFAAKLTPVPSSRRTRASGASVNEIMDSIDRGRSSTQDGQIDDGVAREPALCSWIDCCGLNPDFRQFDGSISPYPRTMSCASFSITFLTPRHLHLVFGFLAGPALVSLQLLLKNYAVVVLLISAQAALLILLVRFERTDDLARLTIECEALRLQEEAVAQQAAEVSEFFNKVALYSELWRNRAAPRLGLMKALHMKLYESPEQAPQLLDCFIHGLKKLDVDCGSMGFWLSDAKPSARASKFFGEKVDECASYAERLEPEELLLNADKVFQVIRAVKVRVLGAAHLPYGGFFDKVDPYVKIRVASSDWQRTKTLSNKCNPRWDQGGNPPEFVFYMMPEDTCLELEVFDEDLASADDLMGSTKTRFNTEVMRSSSKSGDWVSKHVRLTGDGTKKLNKDSKIELMLQFATDMHRLTDFMDQGPAVEDQPKA